MHSTTSSEVFPNLIYLKCFSSPMVSKQLLQSRILRSKVRNPLRISSWLIFEIVMNPLGFLVRKMRL